ncbi:helix-turn-helix domain-containing protein [Kutzneria sp. 744]|uniref:helix-turn-helix domain-containing protein n=1 Tax=Kutzneria sp. (strain 744) TaxID=345341 RepID=UPI0003EEA53E|nr:XRE family transcriptional regulator [Kutzneria sp. 744]EWM18634.1 toxin-antitoxin system, antitoxin component, Xre family [Kutzneria sp. 744]
MDRAAQIVAANVRHHRARAQLSLADLARLSGVAKATLSSLEAGVGNPTIQTLWSIANALGAGFSDLLVEPADEAEVHVVRGTVGVVTPEDGAEAIELYSRWPARGITESYAIVLGEGTRYEAGPHAMGTVEHLIVVEGAAFAGPAGKLVRLERFDYARFPADRPHVYESIDGPARCLLIVSYAPHQA